jgi:prolipoprotein diacylglyceryltransferase
LDKIAYIIGETFIYWNSIILILAAAAAICMFLGLYLREKGTGISAALLVPLAVVASIIAARAVHWYCRADAYTDLKGALTTFTGGGYALMGVFAGCALAAAVLRLLGIIRNLPHTFDCMALGGGVGIALGRLACLYNTMDRGPVMETLRDLPLVYPVNNAVTGVVEWRFATFMIQAIVTGIITVGLLVFYLIGQRGKICRLKDGDAACLWLCAYGASQVVLDSTRYDSLFMRSNGFISIVQILGAAALILTFIYFSVRMVKARGFKWWYVPVWLVYAGCTGGAGFMEYWVQRHGDQAVFSYSIMGACTLGLSLMVMVVRHLAVTKEWENALVENNKKTVKA